MASTSTELGIGTYGNVTRTPGTEDGATKHTSVFEGLHLSGNYFEAVFAATSIARPLPLVNVVAFRGLTTCERNKFHIEMERGKQTLWDHSASKSWDQRNAMIDGVLKDLSTALHQLHCTGIVHCDLKPSNIIVLEDQDEDRLQVRLIDFGNSRFWNRPVAPRTGRREVSCTYEFCAPEALRNKHELTPACDAYALGATIYSFLMRRYLWVADRSPKTSDVQRSVTLDALHLRTDGIMELAEAPSGMSNHLFGILKGLLHPDPRLRLAVATLASDTADIPPLILDGPPVPEKHRHHTIACIDQLYKMCVMNNSDAAFTLAVNIALRFAGATKWPVPVRSLRACLTLAVAVNNPDHLGATHVDHDMLLTVMKTLGFSMYADTCDWLLTSVHGHPTINMPLLCSVLKLCDGRTQESVELYLQHSDYLVIE